MKDERNRKFAPEADDHVGVTLLEHAPHVLVDQIARAHLPAFIGNAVLLSRPLEPLDEKLHEGRLLRPSRRHQITDNQGLDALLERRYPLGIPDHGACGPGRCGKTQTGGGK